MEHKKQQKKTYAKNICMDFADWGHTRLKNGIHLQSALYREKCSTFYRGSSPGDCKHKMVGG